MTIRSDLASFRAPISRRGLIVSAGAAGLAVAARPYGAFAAGPEATLKVGFVSPRTGALAGFGETDGYVLELARKALARGSRSAARPTGSRSSTATPSPILRAPASSPRR